MIFLASLSLCLCGCHKIKNPHPEASDTHSLCVCNYCVYNPDKPRKTKTKETKITRYEGLVLHVLTWPNFLPKSILNRFTEEYGAKIISGTVETNHELRNRIAQGENWDVILGTGYTVQRMLNENLLAELNSDNIPNLANIDPEFRSVAYDLKNKHSIPFAWGTCGIGFNFGHLDKPPRKWEDLFSPDTLIYPVLKGQLALMPSSRRAFAAALIRLGLSPNSQKMEDLTTAAKFLQEHMFSHRYKIVGTTMAEALANRDIMMSMAMGFDVAKAHKLNPRILFSIPEDGTWISVENFAIPKNTPPQQKILAEAFLNYLLHPTIAAEFTNYSYHACTMSSARSYIHAEIKNGPAYMRPHELPLLLADSEISVYQETTWQKILETSQTQRK